MAIHLSTAALLLAALAAASLAGCTPSEGIARYCVAQGHAEGTPAFQDCVEERQSDRRLRYLKGGAGAGSGG